MSARAMECLDIEMRNGWRGHFEALIPTIIVKHGLTKCDIGNDGVYTDETHTWMSLQVQPLVPNKIYHPIKEKALYDTDKKNCLISVVGEYSSKKTWLCERVKRNYDIHLIVYDSSFWKHYDNADFVYGKIGKKVDLIKDYFDNHECLLSQYKYYFVIDEDSQLDSMQINDLFDEMEKDNNEFSLIGLTMPCIRQDIMKQLMNENPRKSAIYF